MKTKANPSLRGRLSMTAHCLWVLFVFAGAAAPLCAQSVILQTGSNQPIQTISVPLTIPSPGLQPVLMFQFGFSTGETNSPGGFLDSWAFTLQSNDGLATALILIADAQGVAWAPPNPGGVPLNPGDITRTAISVPSFAQGYPTAFAWSLSVPVPAAFAAGSATLYFDLFDNLAPPGSLGWADNVAIGLVPEPSALVLGLLGAALALLQKKRSRP